MSDPAAEINNRAPLAATFKVRNNGVKFTVIANHLKSKGCDGATGADLDQGDLQGCWNARRVQQVDELRAFVRKRCNPRATVVARITVPAGAAHISTP